MVNKLKKTERSISWSIYIAALVVSAIIFGSGLWIGLQIEKNVSEELTRTAERINQRWVSLETLLLLEDSPMLCDYLEEQMKVFDSETFELGAKIGLMEERRGVDPTLKSEYMSLEMRDYLVAQRINEKCMTNTTLILYFVSSSDCVDCKQQGAALTNAREQGDIRVYTFDMSVNNSMISSVARLFDVATYPSLVINKERYAGLHSAEDVLSIVNGKK